MCNINADRTRPATNDGAGRNEVANYHAQHNSVAVAKKRNMKKKESREQLLLVCALAAAAAAVGTVSGLPEPSAGLGPEVK